MATFNDIVGAQGWNQDSEIIVLKGFISKNGQLDDLTAYAQRIADEENDEES